MTRDQKLDLVARLAALFFERAEPSAYAIMQIKLGYQVYTDDELDQELLALEDARQDLEAFA
jgi:hypothetical protein